MLPTPVQIKEKLSRALDDNNEIDEADIVEMVSILEKYPITRSTLEETKIGKMVNDLRRKIKNEKLAKRLKQLVRNWKKILDETAPVNGVKGQSPALRLHASPAVSPALASGYGTGRLPSPASFRSKPNTPTLNVRQSVSPALLGAKSGAVAGQKGGSPALRLNQAASANVQKVASPALAASRPKTPVPSVSGRVASPAASGCVISPSLSGQMSSAIPSHMASLGLTGRVSSPAGNGHVDSPGMAVRTLPAAGTGRMSSPALGHVKGQPNPSAASPVQSCALRRTSPVAGTSGKQGRVATKQRSKSKRNEAVVSEKSNFGGRITPSSLHSDSSQDRVIEENSNGRHDSDDGSSCNSTRTSQLSHSHPLNHSTDLLLSNSSNKNCLKDQRELSKTNIANRKRTREEPSFSSESSKKSKSASSSLSLNNHKPDKVVNGYARSSKKSLPGIDSLHVGSPSSHPVHRHTSSPLLSHSLTAQAGSSKSDLLLRHDSSDSHISAQSCDRPLRDKHKVKTTEQLIEALQKKNNSSNVGNSVMTQLRTHQIEREKDMTESKQSAGVQSRGKNGRRGTNNVIDISVPSSDMMLSQAKNELVERFLKTSDPSSPVDEYSPYQDDLLPNPTRSVQQVKSEMVAGSSHGTKEKYDGSVLSSHQKRSESARKDDGTDAVSASLPGTSQTERSGSALTLQEIYAQLPPVDNDIDWNAVDFYELPEKRPVTDDFVTQLHNEHLPGINGLYDINGEWTTWQQTLTLPSYEGNQLHILPYVDLDK